MKNALTILVVDDEPINISMVANVLSPYYNLKVATDGEEALNIIFSDEKPDLILLDIMMPRMNGYEVAQAICSDPTTRHIPFIFLTSKQSSEQILRGFEAGASDYILKPFNDGELLARVKTHLQLHTLKKELARTLARRERDLGLIDRHILMLHLDLQGSVIRASRAYLNLTGYTLEELVNRKLGLYLHHKIRADVYNEMWKTISEGGVWKGELLNSTKEGEEYWLDVTISPEDDENGIRTGYMVLATNITNQKIIERLSEHDHLTDVYNRKKTEMILGSEYERAVRYNGIFSVIICDIDHFKSVNDTFGHQCGDEVLKLFARTCSDSLRQSDVFGRIGGEEFMVICPQTTLQGATDVAEKLRSAVESVEFPGGVGRCTASFGVAHFNLDGETVEQLIKRADDALYRAKERGRNCVVAL